MDVNLKKWSKVYGRLLKDILNLYSIDRFTLIEGIKATKDDLRQWLSGNRLPPNIYHNNICKVLRKHISEKKWYTR